MTLKPAVHVSYLFAMMCHSAVVCISYLLQNVMSLRDSAVRAEFRLWITMQMDQSVSLPGQF